MCLYAQAGAQGLHTRACDINSVFLFYFILFLFLFCHSASNDTCVGEVTRTSRRSSTVVIANQTSDSKMERSLVTLINRINKPEKSESEDDTKLLEDSDDFQTEDNIYSDLSTEYRQTHFISGLLLNEISLILEGK